MYSVARSMERQQGKIEKKILKEGDAADAASFFAGDEPRSRAGRISARRLQSRNVPSGTSSDCVPGNL